ncbi:MAG: class I SAM-dependent methyltransferase [Chitinophagaceae bacterium]|nr:class I SAM-dependent methyltransferase [Chitinophagaceae bacterium]
MNNASFSFGGPIPELYDRYLGPYIFEPYAQDIAARIKLPVKQVLEVAAGTGRVTHHIAGCIGKDARLTATDINADMLAVARQRVNAPHIEWMTANAMELPFDDNYFDCVVCQFGYMFLNDRQKGFDEALRVLKPGGQFLFSTWDKVENNITAYISRQIVTAFFKDDPPEFYKVPFSMYDPAELEAHLVAAGFGNHTVQRVSFMGESESAMHIATGFVEGNPIINEIVKHDPSQLEQIKARIAAQIHSQVSSDPVRSPMNAWVGEGYKKV